MNNYVYIIAGLPDFTPDWRQGEKSLDEYLDQVRELLSEKDNKVLDFIVKGFDKDQIGLELYKEALSHRLGFIREFFQFDLNVRNQKVRYLNQALGRDPEKDVLSLRDPEAEETGLEPEEPEFKESAKLQSILEGHDILSRERGIDDLYWDKIDELTLFDYLNFDKILGVMVKMMIIRRWLILDEEPVRAMFKKLVDEGTYGKVKSALLQRKSAPPYWGWDNWYLDYSRSGGAIMDLHIHDIDYARCAFGEPKEVSCSTADIVSGKATLESLSEYALKLNVVEEKKSGAQEYLESIVNQIMFGGAL